MRRKDKPEQNFWIGYLDGPPIGQCPTADRLRANAIAGSRQLASTILFLGLRP
jgi:hypothetical protein